MWCFQHVPLDKRWGGALKNSVMSTEPTVVGDMLCVACETLALCLAQLRFCVRLWTESINHRTYQVQLMLHPDFVFFFNVPARAHV